MPRDKLFVAYPVNHPKPRDDPEKSQANALFLLKAKHAECLSGHRLKLILAMHDKHRTHHGVVIWSRLDRREIITLKSADRFRTA